jgi:hypothetical protein
MKAKINNQILRVQIMNDSYNDHAVEVKILEGTFKDKCTIVEKADLITPAKLTLNQLVKLVKSEINISDLEQNILEELVTVDAMETIQYNVNFLVSLNNKEYETFKYSTYAEEYNNIEYTKLSILTKTIEAIIDGEKRTIAQTKKIMLSECE